MNKIIFSLVFLGLIKFQSIAQSATWQQVSTHASIGAAVINNSLFVAADNGIQMSSDYGLTWTVKNANLPQRIELVASGNDLYTSDDSGVYKSSDFGATFTLVSPNTLAVRVMIIHGNDIYAGTVDSQNDGVYKSSLTNIGPTTWTSMSNSFPNKFIHSLAVCGSDLLAGAEGGNIYRTPLTAISWTNSAGGVPSVPATYAIMDLAVNGTTVFAGLYGGYQDTQVMRSTDSGHTWTKVSTSVFDACNVFDILIKGDTIMTATNWKNIGPVFSYDNGITWAVKNSGLLTQIDRNMGKLIFVGNTLFGTAQSGVWRYNPESGTVGIKMGQEGTLIRMFPNPVNSTLIIENENLIDAKIEAFNIFGELICTIVLDKQRQEFDITKWCGAGIYYMRIIDANDKIIETKKIVVE